MKKHIAVMAALFLFLTSVPAISESEVQAFPFPDELSEIEGNVSTNNSFIVKFRSDAEVVSNIVVDASIVCEQFFAEENFETNGLLEESLSKADFEIGRAHV